MPGFLVSAGVWVDGGPDHRPAPAARAWSAAQAYASWTKPEDEDPAKTMGWQVQPGRHVLPAPRAARESATVSRVYPVLEDIDQLQGWNAPPPVLVRLALPRREGRTEHTLPDDLLAAPVLGWDAGAPTRCPATQLGRRDQPAAGVVAVDMGRTEEAVSWYAVAPLPPRRLAAPPGPADSRPLFATVPEELAALGFWRQDVAAVPRPPAARQVGQAGDALPSALQPPALPWLQPDGPPRRLPPPALRDVLDPAPLVKLGEDLDATLHAGLFPAAEWVRPVAQPRRGQDVLTLDVAQFLGVWVFTQDPVMPRAYPRPVREAAHEAAEPWLATSIIVVAGPYVIPSATLYVSGAVAGGVITL